MSPPAGRWAQSVIRLLGCCRRRGVGVPGRLPRASPMNSRSEQNRRIPARTAAHVGTCSAKILRPQLDSRHPKRRTFRWTTTWRTAKGSQRCWAGSCHRMLPTGSRRPGTTRPMPRCTNTCTTSPQSYSCSTTSTGAVDDGSCGPTVHASGCPAKDAASNKRRRSPIRVLAT
jgi:hypothetical protein